MANGHAQEGAVRVLIADAAEPMRLFLGMCLSEQLRVEPSFTGSGDETMTRLASELFDVMLLECSGGSLASIAGAVQTCREAGAELAVVAYGTAAEAPAELQKTLATAGAYLPKPFSAHGLRQAVRAARHLDEPPLPEGAERRRAPRLSTPLRARFGRTASQSLIAQDVSFLGAFLRADGDGELPALGQPGFVVIEFPHLKEPIGVECRVVRVRPQAAGQAAPRGFAIEFNPTTTERQRLAASFRSPDAADDAESSSS
jgi:DNA-binding response OmpR family regulator